NETDNIEIMVSDAVLITGSSLVTIDGNGNNGQSFPKGIPVQLEYSATFSDGRSFSTIDHDNDADFMTWIVHGDTGAFISDEGVLDTNGVSVGTVLTVTATGNSPYEDETDSIDVIVSDAVLSAGTSIVTIDGNSENGQSFPIGIPVQLEFSANFSDGTRFSTVHHTNDADFMTWTIEGDSGATINDEGLLNTFGVAVGTTLTITATANSPYESESDSIEVFVSEAVILDYHLPENIYVPVVLSTDTDGQGAIVDVKANMSDGSEVTVSDAEFTSSSYYIIVSPLMQLYSFAPGFDSQITVSHNNNHIGTINAFSIGALDIDSSGVWTLHTRSDAEAICSDSGLSLPTTAMLQQFFIDSTTADTAPSSLVNEDVCTRYGWPLLTSIEVCKVPEVVSNDGHLTSSSDGYWSRDNASSLEHVTLTNGAIVTDKGDAHFALCVSPAAK
ncbi:hypothetical protein L1076_18690, partial [Vibrio sp. MMG022]|uniref:hypothetical protein n=1 Tax=Vibrio sp. MMG023 TaxID=2909979 RepID=UPI001F3EB550